MRVKMAAAAPAVPMAIAGARAWTTIIMLSGGDKFSQTSSIERTEFGQARQPQTLGFCHLMKFSQLASAPVRALSK